MKRVAMSIFGTVVGVVALLSYKAHSPLATPSGGLPSAALPNTSILIMSPMDRGERSGANQITTMRAIPEIVAIQQRVAERTGCGFFNTYHAMGANGTSR